MQGGDMKKRKKITDKRVRCGAALLAAVMLVSTFAGCGSKAKEKNLAGTSEEILNKVYETAELGTDFESAMENFQTTPIDETMEEYILGTDQVDYTDAVCSAPMINVIAYQCVVLRLAQGEDAAEAKQLLLDNADPRKWICVEAESVVVESVGDVILYVMADQETADAIKTSFLALGES